MLSRKYPEGAEKLEDGILFKDESFLEFCDRRLIILYELWKSKKKGDLLPRRADFDPSEMKELLPHIFMVDRKTPTNEFRYRLVGTQEVQFRGIDPTGKLVKDTCAAENPDDALKNYEYIFSTGNFLFNLCEFNGRRLIIEDHTLFLPTASDHKNVDIIIAISYQVSADDY